MVFNATFNNISVIYKMYRGGQFNWWRKLRLDRMLFDTFRVSFVSSQGFSKNGNPDVLKLFHRYMYSVWMIRISVLVKVNGIRHYSFSIRSNRNYSAILASVAEIAE
jgi:hypothetical protein